MIKPEDIDSRPKNITYVTKGQLFNDLYDLTYDLNRLDGKVEAMVEAAGGQIVGGHAIAAIQSDIKTIMGQIEELYQGMNALGDMVAK